MTGSCRIIVNADDFGMSSQINHAIVEAFQKNLISSTTMMANMPAFDEACALAHRYELMDRIGVHLNLTEGQPLTRTITRCSRFCDEQGNLRRRRTTFRLRPAEEAAIKEELDAQVKKCLMRGIRVTHLDSHHHVHTEWAIGRVVIEVAKQNGIPAIRLTRNYGPGITVSHRLYKYAYNSRLALNGLAKTRYFVYFADAPSIIGEANSDIEIMVHTRRAANGAMADLDGADIERGIKALNIGNLLSSYGQLEASMRPA